jgi:DNA end-binding protein Ku
MAARSIWKGAISFGLVHVPVALVPAATSNAIDFDWLDKRTMDPVGYKRINKRTGKEIDKDHIVRGVKVDKSGRYVVLGDDEIKAALPRSTQTIEIEHFVKAPEVPFTYLDRPYWMEPSGRGAPKVYALLREAMAEAGVIGIARVVMHTKEHLAALVPAGPALMLNTLRWSNELRDGSELDLPAAGRKAAGLKDTELAMARRLIDDMTGEFDAERYTDRFADAVRKLIERRVKAGDTEAVEPMEEALPEASNVVDLAELLKRSLGAGRGGAANGAGDGAGDGGRKDGGKAARAGAAPRKAAPRAGGSTRGGGNAAKGHAAEPARKRA